MHCNSFHFISTNQSYHHAVSGKNIALNFIHPRLIHTKTAAKSALSRKSKRSTWAMDDLREMSSRTGIWLESGLEGDERVMKEEAVKSQDTRKKNNTFRAERFKRFSGKHGAFQFS